MLASNARMKNKIERSRCRKAYEGVRILSKYSVPGHVTKKAAKLAASKPTSGLVGVVLAWRFGASEITVYGFNGLQDGHWYNPGIHRKTHNGGRELRWLQRMHDDGKLTLVKYGEAERCPTT